MKMEMGVACCSIRLGVLMVLALAGAGCTAPPDVSIVSEDLSPSLQEQQPRFPSSQLPTLAVIIKNPPEDHAVTISQSQVVSGSLSAAPEPDPDVPPLSFSPADNLAPLEFSFPSAEKEPVSLWRPPLYPTPWEPTPQDHFYFSRPIGANDVNWPLSIYRYGYLFYTEPHTGIDIPTPKGTPIMAAGPGTVIHAGYGIYTPNSPQKDPYGIAVLIKHDFGYAGQVLYTVYGHMDETYVYPGQHVETGEVIGIVGETGKTSGPHLHFEVRVGDHRFFFTRNPELWIAPPQGWGLLVGQVLEQNGRKIPRAKLKLVNPDTQKIYEAVSYAEGISIRGDAYYNENLVLGDIPAGVYLLYLEYNGSMVRTTIEIKPGRVSFFCFRSKRGFDFTRPAAEGDKFSPPEQSLSPDPILPLNPP